MADYSTTIGVFQSQVGKSGDILLKFEHKNGGERGIRTLERENPLTIFETVAFGHSAISPQFVCMPNISQKKEKSRENYGFF